MAHFGVGKEAAGIVKLETIKEALILTLWKLPPHQDRAKSTSLGQ